VHEIPIPIRPLGKPFEWVASAGSETLETALAAELGSEVIGERDWAIVLAEVAKTLQRLEAGLAKRGADLKRIKSAMHALLWELRWELYAGDVHLKLRLYMVEEKTRYQGLLFQLKSGRDSSEESRSRQNLYIRRALDRYEEYVDTSDQNEIE
jgi:hypothetical protein